MRARPIIAGIALVALLAGSLQLATPAPERPDPDAPAEVQPREEPVAAEPSSRSPRSRATLRRPTPPAPAVREPQSVEPSEAEPSEPWSLDDLPDEDRARLGRQALDRLSDLHEACSGAIDTPALVLLSMTVDDRGLLELEIASYDGEVAAIAPGVPLPEALIDCLDDEVWDLDWPAWEPGLSFALTAPFEPDPS